MSKSKFCFIHTTHKVIPFIDVLGKLHYPDSEIYHFLDESILTDIDKKSYTLAGKKLNNLIQNAESLGPKKIIITCTATGNLIKNILKDTVHADNIFRIETPAILEIKNHKGLIGVVYTNAPVWDQIVELMSEYNIDKERLYPYYVPGAFKAMLEGDTAKHDLLVLQSMRNNKNAVDLYFLAQVSLCAMAQRTDFKDVDVPVVSMAEIGVIYYKS